MDRSRREVKAPKKFMTSEDLIAEVQARPALWDESLPEYRDRLLKRKLWQEIANCYVSSSPKDCQRTWLNLRKALSNHRNAWERKHGRSGCASAIYKPYKYESLMSFLNNYNGTDNMDGNLDGVGNGNGEENICEGDNNDESDDDDNEDEDSTSDNLDLFQNNSPHLSGIKFLPNTSFNITDDAPFQDLTNKKISFVKDSTQRKLFLTPTPKHKLSTPQNKVSFVFSPPSSPSRKKSKLLSEKKLSEVKKENKERMESKTPLKVDVEKSVRKTTLKGPLNTEESKKARKERIMRERQAELEKKRESVVKKLQEEVLKAEEAQSMWDSSGNRKEATAQVSCSIEEAIIKELQRDDDPVTLFLGSLKQSVRELPKTQYIKFQLQVLRLVEDLELESSKKPSAEKPTTGSDLFDYQLCPQMLREAEAVLDSEEDQQCVVVGNISLYGRDLHTLKDEGLLNDKIINSYFFLLSKRDSKRIMSMDTFFMHDLMMANVNLTDIQRWGSDLKNFAYILVPAHRAAENHWGLIFVDIEGCTISYLDSLGGKYPEGLSKLKQFLAHDTGKADWTEVDMKNIPRQLNSVDCGVFTCMYANLLSAGLTWNFDQSSMTHIRKRMAYELAHGLLLPLKLVCSTENQPGVPHVKSSLL